MEYDTTIQSDTAERHLKKYTNKNPLQKFALGRFFEVVGEEIDRIGPKTTLEFGCGEGLFAQKLLQQGVNLGDYTGVDIRPDAIAYANNLINEANVEFKCADIFSWPSPGTKFDLVISSQVFEHLPDPEPFLKRLIELSNDKILLTVPWEPWFRFANLIRGRDILRFGNHPEHVQQWNADSFSKFLAPLVHIERVFTCFPFVIAICRPPSVATEQDN